MALIKEVGEYRRFLPIGAAKDLSSLPDIETAEERFIVPILGFKLYSQLQEAYDGKTLSDEQKNLLKCAQKVIAPFAYYLNLAFGQVQLTGGGMVAIEGDNIRRAFKWEYQKIEDALIDKGYSAQESLILYLQEQKTDFPFWADSPYNDPEQFSFIRNGFELFKALAIDQPHRSYMVLKPVFQTVSELYIDEALGTTYYTALAGRIMNDTVTGVEKEVVSLLRQAVARLAMQQAASESCIRFDGRSGFTVVDARLRDAADEGKTAASEARMNRYTEEMKSSGQKLLRKALDLLNANASTEVAPEFFASTKYTDPNKPKSVPFKNDKRKIFITQ